MKRILVIDDSLIAQKVAGRTLENAGFSVTTLTDPTAFQPDPLDTPDLILVDVDMPQIYGDDLVVYLRDDLKLTSKIMLYSGMPDAELSFRASACGADAFISKNADLADLVNKVRSALG